MKKAWCFIIAIVFIFSSCDDTYLSAPFVPKSDILENEANGSHGKVPANPSASHGVKRGITVSWDLVSDAVLYYVYRANSPLDTFSLCAETTSNQFSFNVPPGSSVYYRVTSVLYDGTESSPSNYVIGTSLAQPVISDITDISEDSAAVTWYMENVSDNTYRKDLLYVVYCFNGDTEVAQVMLEASSISENRTVFNGLNANTRYEYIVEAYLRSDQSANEKSEKVDAATARRFRPGPPVELRAARGTAADKIELTFELPDMVDIALGDNTYDPKPLYFTISKRLYSENHNNEYQLVSAYFGVFAETASEKNGATFSEYTPGALVSWIDNHVVRGTTYEYMVQSYVDNTSRIISSTASQASATGWAISAGTVSYGKPKYELNNDGTLYKSAELPVSFDFDPKGETYTYTVNAKVEPIEDTDVNNPNAEFLFSSDPLDFEDVKEYKLEMDLTGKSAVTSLGRGIYSVEVKVGFSGGEEICTFKALGSLQISEDTRPIVVENFHIQDGYKDQFVLIWDNYLNRQYTIERSDNGEDPWTVIGFVNENPDDSEETVKENFKHTVTGYPTSATRYFRIRPARNIGSGALKSGQPVYAPGAKTLGVPELSLNTAVSYSLITPLWTDAQKADTYRIKYRYTEDGENAAYTVAAAIKKEDLTIDAAGKYRYSFRPQGYDDALKAGKEIQIAIDALNEGLQKTTGSGEISTSSKEDVRTSLVGPALLNLSAGKAVSSQNIDVSWDSVSGAGGYYVFRRQFNMNNSAEEGKESIVYYIPASTSSSIDVTGKNLAIDTSNSKVDTPTVKAAASFSNSRYTLKDMYLPDNEYDSAAYNRHTQVYRDQQNDIAQGLSYRYFVVPVIVRGNTPDPLAAIEFSYNKDGSNKHTDIASYTVRENGFDINYSEAAGLEQDGFTIGFGQNVTATKGTYASTGNTNNGIQITWNAPTRLSTVAGFTPKYTVYRRTTGGSTWTSVVTNIDNSTYIDIPQERGIAYEYAVGISNANGGSAFAPQDSKRFIALCAIQRDEKEIPNMLGYMLGMVRLESVSRSELRDSANNFAEEVKWYSSGINSIYNTAENNSWGLDGYDIFVMNRNVDGNWHRIADMKNIPKQLNLSIKVSNVQGGDTLQSGLLKVLRDYRHYFKVRSYVMRDSEKIYSPDPDWDYETLFVQNRTNQDNVNFLQTDYVKWGARQIDHTEFAKIANLHIAWGIQWAAGNSRSGWTTRWSYIRWSNQSSNNGSGGRIGIETSFGVGKWWFNIQNFKPDMDTNANKNSFTYSVTFLTIDTGSQDSNKIIYADSNATSQFPQWYGRDGNYGSDFADVKGPSCVASLYSGQLRYNSFSWTGGNVEVRYPAGSTSVNVTNAQVNSPLPFQQQDPNRRMDTDAWY